MNENVVTVEDLLEMPSLSGIKLLAGRNGLRRKIASVTVVDTPDGSAWLRGEELVLTTAFAVKNDKRLLTELVYQLHKKNAAGPRREVGPLHRRNSARRARRRGPARLPDNLGPGKIRLPRHNKPRDSRRRRQAVRSLIYSERYTTNFCASPSTATASRTCSPR